MSPMNRRCVAAAFALLSTGGVHASEVQESPQFHKPGFITYLDDGRLWVFRADSKELADFRANPEPAIVSARIGKGPEGMTVKSANIETVDAYLAAIP